jgi:hypothetical protein
VENTYRFQKIARDAFGWKFSSKPERADISANLNLIRGELFMFSLCLRVKNQPLGKGAFFSSFLKQMALVCVCCGAGEGMCVCVCVCVCVCLHVFAANCFATTRKESTPVQSGVAFRRVWNKWRSCVFAVMGRACYSAN